MPRVRSNCGDLAALNPRGRVHVRYVGEAQVAVWCDRPGIYAGRVETLDGITWDFTDLGIPADLRYYDPDDNKVIDQVVEVAVHAASDSEWNHEGTADDFAEAIQEGSLRRRRVSSAPPKPWLELATLPANNPRGRINQKDYTHYIVVGDRIESGWSYLEDAKEHRYDNEAFLAGKGNVRVVSKRLLKAEGIDPDVNANWMTSNPQSLTKKGERMYEHVKSSYRGDPRAKEIAARTVLARSKKTSGLRRKNPHGRDPVITLGDLIEQLELWNDNTDGNQGGEDVYVIVWDQDPDPEKNEWTIKPFYKRGALEAHKRQYGGKYAKVHIPGHNKPFNAHRVATQAFQDLGLRILNPRKC